MITGKTESGFRYELDEETLDDYELLEILCDIDNGNESLITKACETDARRQADECAEGTSEK